MRLVILIIAALTCASGSLAQSSPKLDVQTDKAHSKVTALTFERIDTRVAIGRFLQAFKKRFVIDESVKGTFSLRLKNKPFHAAWIAVLAASNVSCELVDGTYRVSRGGHIDVPQAASSESQPDQRITIDLKDAEVRDGIRSIFMMCRGKYSLAPDVKGKVNVSLHKVSLEVALKIICESVGATWRLEDGVYHITKRV